MNTLSSNISSLDKSIVVLPFRNLSGDVSYEYFCDGITEEIISALSKINGLKVTARTSSFAFKGKPTDIRIIGNELGVTNAVEGSIRIANDRIRIMAQLTRTDTGFLLWSEKFDRKLVDVFELQDEISVLIADKIRENFGHIDIDESLTTVHTQNLKAYQWYLKGRYYQLTWSLSQIEKAIDYYQQSARIDTSYADPVVAIGWCYAILASWGHIDRVEGLLKANEYLDKGYELNADSYMGHFAKATISFWGNWNFVDGYQELLECLRVNPFFGEANEALAELYTANGLFDEAMKETDKILKINPLSPNHYYTRGNIYFLQKDYKNAIQCFESSLRLDSSFDLSRHLKLACFLFQKDKEATMSYARAFLDDSFIIIVESIFDAINHKKTIQYDENLLSEDVNLMVHWDFYYLIYCRKTDEVLHRLEHMVQNRIGQILNFQFDPFLEPIRTTETYKRLISVVFGNVELPVGNVDHYSKKEKQSGFSNEEVKLLELKVSKYLYDNQAFLNPDLSLRSMAATIELHPNKLSKFINDYLQTNFSELINSKRLEHFKKIAVDPKNKHLTLLGLAYDSGFNSKTVFNTYFKKVIGMTPKQWMKN